MSAAPSTATRAPVPAPARDRRLLAAAALSAVVFLAATALAASGDPPRWEIGLFERINQLPDALYWVIWPFMQYGVFVTIPIATAIALLRYRRRLAVLLGVSGVGIYLAAKVVKEVADRGRPGAYLAAVEAREHFTPGSLGYTSGHAAVAATIATLTVTHLGRPWRELSVVLVGIVAFGRMYVGAHLPLDLVGGIAMGVATGAAATYVFGSHRPRREEEEQMDTRRAPSTAPGTSADTVPAPAPPSARHPGDAIRVVVGLAVIGIALLAVQRDELTTFEGDLFRLINNLPSALAPVLEVVMQAGNVGAAAAFGLLMLLVARRYRRAGVDVALAGGLAWIAAKYVKDTVERPRPTGFFEDVLRFETEGLGFVSGHTAVAAAIATAAGPYLSRRWRQALWLLPWVVGFTRIYFGAHLPLDVVGGAALGWVVGAALHLALGAPHQVPGLHEAARVLRRAGHEVTGLRRAPGTPLGSFPFVAETERGTTFVKLLDPERRDRDWIYRAARLLAFRDVRDEAAVLDASALAHREAAMTLLATCHGARVPAVGGIEGAGDQVWLVQEHIEGLDLDQLPPDTLTDDVLRDIWAQVARIHGARVAHRDLVASNVLVDDDGQAWIVDFAHALSAAPARAFDNDVAELLASTSLLVGPERAVAGARDAIGDDAVSRALPELQLLALTAENRRRLRRTPGALPALRSNVAAIAGTLAPRPLPTLDLRRSVWTVAPALVAVGGLVAIGGAGDVAETFVDPAPRWLGLAALALVAARLSSAVGVVAAVGHRLAVGRVALLELVANTAGLVAGRRAGREELVAQLERTGVPRDGAWRGLRRLRAATTAAWVAALSTAMAAVLFSDDAPELPDRVGWLAGLGALVLAAHVAGARVVAGRRSGGDDEQPPLAGHHQVEADRAELVLGVSARIAAGAVCAAAAAAAMGGGAPVAGVVVAHLAVVGLAAHGPVPGAPGTGEIILAAGLTAFGMGLAPAVAAALGTRLLLVWLPAVGGGVLRMAADRHAH